MSQHNGLSTGDQHVALILAVQQLQHLQQRLCNRQAEAAAEQHPRAGNTQLRDSSHAECCAHAAALAGQQQTLRVIAAAAAAMEQVFHGHFSPVCTTGSPTASHATDCRQPSSKSAADVTRYHDLNKSSMCDVDQLRKGAVEAQASSTAASHEMAAQAAMRAAVVQAGPDTLQFTSADLCSQPSLQQHAPLCAVAHPGQHNGSSARAQEQHSTSFGAASPVSGAASNGPNTITASDLGGNQLVHTHRSVVHAPGAATTAAVFGKLVAALDQAITQRKHCLTDVAAALTPAAADSASTFDTCLVAATELLSQLKQLTLWKHQFQSALDQLATAPPNSSKHKNPCGHPLTCAAARCSDAAVQGYKNNKPDDQHWQVDTQSPSTALATSSHATSSTPQQPDHRKKASAARARSPRSCEQRHNSGSSIGNRSTARESRGHSTGCSVSTDTHSPAPGVSCSKSPLADNLGISTARPLATQFQSNKVPVASNCHMGGSPTGEQLPGGSPTAVNNRGHHLDLSRSNVLAGGVRLKCNRPLHDQTASQAGICCHSQIRCTGNRQQPSPTNSGTSLAVCRKPRPISGDKWQPAVAQMEDMGICANTRQLWPNKRHQGKPAPHLTSADKPTASPGMLQLQCALKELEQSRVTGFGVPAPAACTQSHNCTKNVGKQHAWTGEKDLELQQTKNISSSLQPSHHFLSQLHRLLSLVQH